MYGLVYSNFANFSEKFANMDDSGSMFLGLLAVAAVVVIQLFVVKFLWNTVLVRVLSVAKPLPSLLYTFGLLVLMMMLFPGL